MNQRGSVVLWGLVLSGMIGVATIGAGTYYENFSRRAHEAQVRSRLTAFEGQIRSMAYQPYAYKCGADNGSNAISNIQTCALNTDYWTPNVTFVPQPGADCGTKSSCGFRMTELTFTPSGQIGLFHAKIVYEGAEAQMIRPSVIDLQIPTELLKSSSFNCAVNTPNQPVLTGFDANGGPICTGFTPIVNAATGAKGSETQPCPKGTYLTVVNWNSLTFVCTNLNTPDKIVSCPQDQAVTHVTFANGVMSAPCDYLPAAPFN